MVAILFILSFVALTVAALIQPRPPSRGPFEEACGPGKRPTACYHESTEQGITPAPAVVFLVATTIATAVSLLGVHVIRQRSQDIDRTGSL